MSSRERPIWCSAILARPSKPTPPCSETSASAMAWPTHFCRTMANYRGSCVSSLKPKSASASTQRRSLPLRRSRWVSISVPLSASPRSALRTPSQPYVSVWGVRAAELASAPRCGCSSGRRKRRRTLPSAAISIFSSCKASPRPASCAKGGASRRSRAGYTYRHLLTRSWR